MNNSIQLFDKVEHINNEHLKNGTVIKLSNRTATVAWGEEELIFSYKGTRYPLSNLIKK